MADARYWLEMQYQRYGTDILRYLKRHFSPKLSAEDLLQETFIQAMRTMDRPDEIASPQAWLLGIARNVGLMTLRKHRSNMPLPNDLCGKASSDPAPELEAMRSALAELPEIHREILELRLTYRLSYGEISQVLKIPVGTVRSRLHHAVRLLKDQLTPDPNERK